MFRRKQQEYTQDEFIRYFVNRVSDESIARVVYEHVRRAAGKPFVSPLERLYEEYGIADSDLDELVQSILKDLGLPWQTSETLDNRPEVRTTEGLLLLVDYAYRLNRA